MKLHEEIALRGLGDQVFVSPCSHIGGHKYAGNLIVFSPDSEGKLMGHWYGYVTPDDVPAVLDQHIATGEIIKRLWRGQMGSPAAKEGEAGEGQKVPNGQAADKSIKQLEESNGQVSNVPAFSCCGGANGVTCCSDANPETNGDKETAEKQGQEKMSIWARQFEQHEILTAAAVVGAVATVAIAYSIYRRSG
jgi:(2Fe-2S) ferredoxin